MRIVLKARGARFAGPRTDRGARKDLGRHSSDAPGHRRADQNFGILKNAAGAAVSRVDRHALRSQPGPGSFTEGLLAKIGSTMHDEPARRAVYLRIRRLIEQRSFCGPAGGPGANRADQDPATAVAAYRLVDVSLRLHACLITPAAFIFIPPILRPPASAPRIWMPPSLPLDFAVLADHFRLDARATVGRYYASPPTPLPKGEGAKHG